MGILKGLTSTTTAPCRVKVSTSDTVCEYLQNKLKAGWDVGNAQDFDVGHQMAILMVASF